MSFDQNPEPHRPDLSGPSQPNAFPPVPPAGYAPPVAMPYNQPPQMYQQDPAVAVAGPAKVLGICFVILGGLGTLIALALGFFFPVFMAASAAQNPNLNQSAVPGSLGVFLALFVFLLAGLLPFLTGYGLLAHKSWGRVLAIVNSFLIVLSIPVGTALGGFTLYFMFRAGAREGWERLSGRSV